MVDKAKKVDVDVSISEREWNTEEFYAVLNVHTEQVLPFHMFFIVKYQREYVWDFTLAF